MDKAMECVAGEFAKAISKAIGRSPTDPQIEIVGSTARVLAFGRTATGRRILLGADYNHTDPARGHQTNTVKAWAAVTNAAWRHSIKKGEAFSQADTKRGLPEPVLHEYADGPTADRMEAQTAVQSMRATVQAAPARCGLDGP